MKLQSRRPRIVLYSHDTMGLVHIRPNLLIDAIERLAKERTTFLITHSLQHAMRCDLILYLEGGARGGARNTCGADADEWAMRCFVHDANRYPYRLGRKCRRSGVLMPLKRLVYQGELLLEKQNPIKLGVLIRTTKERLYLEAST